MTINDPTLGICYISIQHGDFSSVDSYAEAGYSETFDRDLTDIELDYITDKYSAEIQYESYSGGHSPNHN